MIKRYEPMGPNRALLEHPRGRWVRHETFEMFEALMKRLEAELGEAKAEVERLRAENERLRADRHAQREAAIYGAVFANAYPHVSTRAAQKGGSDG